MLVESYVTTWKTIIFWRDSVPQGVNLTYLSLIPNYSILSNHKVSNLQIIT
jgi:hypothetical protein